MKHGSGVPCCHAGEVSLSVVGDGWFYWCTLITECKTANATAKQRSASNAVSETVQLVLPPDVEEVSSWPFVDST